METMTDYEIYVNNILVDTITATNQSNAIDIFLSNFDLDVYACDEEDA